MSSLAAKFLLFALLCAACASPYDKAVKFYSRDDADSLKYRAALFLREHADFHYGVDRFLADKDGFRVDSVNPLEFANGPEYMAWLDSLGFRFAEGEPVMDADAVTADFLIENIELAFQVWQEPWAKRMTFGDFCSYVLPYRNIDEKISHWRRRLMEKYLPSVKDSVDDCTSHVEVAQYLMRCLKRDLGYSQRMKSFYIDYMTPEETEKMHFLECRALANYGTLVLRACGVPCATILTHWRFTELYHASVYLPALCGDTASYRTSVYDELQQMGLPKDTMASCRTLLYSYEANDELLGLLHEGVVPENLILPVTRRDITDEFSITLQYERELPDSLAGEPYVYLMRFNRWNWYPIRYGKVENGKAVFEKATVHQLYMLGRKDPVSGEIITCGVPFTIDSNGHTDEFCADGEIVTISLAYNCEDTERRPVRRITSSYWTGSGWKNITVDALLWGFNEKTVDYKEYTPELGEHGYKPVFHLASFKVPEWSIIYDDYWERPMGYKKPADEDDRNYMQY